MGEMPGLYITWFLEAVTHYAGRLRRQVGVCVVRGEVGLEPVLFVGRTYGTIVPTRSGPGPRATA